MKLKAKWMGLALAGAALPGCGAILGLDQFSEGAGGGSTATGTSTSRATSSSGASSSTVTGGGACTGVETQSCYDFDMGTLNMGACKAGAKTCKDGMFGACEGQVGPSPEDCSKLGDENCDGVACSDAIWSKEFGELTASPKNFAAVEDLAVLASGNILITGVFTSSINFGTTPATELTASSAHASLFLAELGPDGSHVWSERFQPQGDGAFGARLTVSSTGQIFLSGFYKEAIDLGGKVLTATGTDARDFFAASFDKDGKVLWGKTFGADSSAYVLDLAVGPDGDPVFVGQFGLGNLVLEGQTYSSPMGYDAFVAKLGHTDGSVLWSQSFHDAAGYPVGDQSATAVAVDSKGNITVAGTFNTEVDFGSGLVDFSPSGGLDAFVTQLTANGDPSWHSYFHGPNDEIVSSLVTDSQGDVYIAGAFSGTTQFEAVDIATTKKTTSPTDTDFYLVKMTAQGKHAWMKQFGDTSAQLPISPLLSTDAPLALGVDSKDNVIFAGGFLGSIQIGSATLSSQGDSDWFVGKLTTDGTHLWSKSFGDGAPAQIVAGISADPKTGAVVLAGTNDGTLTISPGAPLKAKGSIDVVVAKLNP